jgi:hypothetical protein
MLKQPDSFATNMAGCGSWSPRRSAATKPEKARESHADRGDRREERHLEIMFGSAQRSGLHGPRPAR